MVHESTFFVKNYLVERRNVHSTKYRKLLNTLLLSHLQKIFMLYSSLIVAATTLLVFTYLITYVDTTNNNHNLSFKWKTSVITNDNNFKPNNAHAVIRLSSIIDLLSTCDTDFEAHLLSYFNSSLVLDTMNAGPDSYPPPMILESLMPTFFNKDTLTITNRTLEVDLLIEKLNSISLDNARYYMYTYPGDTLSEYYFMYYGELNVSKDDDLISSYAIISDHPLIFYYSQIDGQLEIETRVDFSLDLVETIDKGHHFFECLSPNDFPIRDNVVISRDEYELRYDSSTFNVIGHGATGTIISITEIRSNTSYALKEIPTCYRSKKWYEYSRNELYFHLSQELVGDPSFLLAKNVVFYSRHEIYIIMERASVYGDTSNAIGQLPPASLKMVITNLTTALVYTENRGIINRDIKIGNIVITDAGVVKFIDFGFMTKSTELVVDMMGFPGFMAPEVVSPFQYGVGYTSKVDVYSLGATIYALIFGGTVQHYDNLHHLDLSFLNQTLGQPLGDLLLQMLEVDPSKRPLASELLYNHPYFGTNTSAVYPQIFPLSESNISLVVDDSANVRPQVSSSFLRKQIAIHTSGDYDVTRDYVIGEVASIEFHSISRNYDPVVAVATSISSRSSYWMLQTITDNLLIPRNGPLTTDEMISVYTKLPLHPNVMPVKEVYENNNSVTWVMDIPSSKRDTNFAAIQDITESHLLALEKVVKSILTGLVHLYKYGDACPMHIDSTLLWMHEDEPLITPMMDLVVMTDEAFRQNLRDLDRMFKLHRYSVYYPKEHFFNVLQEELYSMYPSVENLQNSL